MRTTLKALFAAAIFVCCLCVKEGCVGEVHYNDISLEQLVREAPCILVVKKCDKEYTLKEIKIHRDKRRYQPFREVISHFKVEEELFNENGRSIAGKTIDVVPSDLDTKLEVHKAFYLKGISKSPIYEKYDPGLNFDDTEEMVVFLNPAEKKSFAFLAEGAFEDISRKDEITALIQKIKFGIEPETAPDTQSLPL